MKTIIKPYFAVVGVSLIFFVSLPAVQAVSPAPDGGYPGGNTAEGQAALLSLTTGGFNTAVGYLSLRSDTTTNFNTAIGAGALLANTGNSDTATGAAALLSNTTGFYNTADGAFALFSNTTGPANTASGYQALFNNTTGAENTAIGETALTSNTTGDSNTAVGSGALQQNTTGSNNIALGSAAGLNVTTAHDVICIGEFEEGLNVSNTCFIRNIRATTTVNNDAVPVLIDSNGQLGTASSSRRFKNDIKPMDASSESILALKPVTFHYKSDKTNRPEFGLIAEDVAEVNPDLVVRDKDGEIYTVRYDAVNAMLLNEFVKEHRRVEEQDCVIHEQQAIIAQLTAAAGKQDAINAEQRKGMQEITALLKEQESKIEKVSAELEVNKPGPQTALNNHQSVNSHLP
jgi:hypothetical protein